MAQGSPVPRNIFWLGGVVLVRAGLLNASLFISSVYTCTHIATYEMIIYSRYTTSRFTRNTRFHRFMRTRPRSIKGTACAAALMKVASCSRSLLCSSPSCPAKVFQAPAAGTAGNVQQGRQEESRFSQFWRLGQVRATDNVFERNQCEPTSSSKQYSFMLSLSSVSLLERFPRIPLIYVLAVKFLASKSTTPAAPVTTPTIFDPSAPASEQTNAFSLPPTQAELLWPTGISLDMYVYLSTSPNGDVFAHKRTMSYNKEDELPSFVWGNITFGDWSEKRVADLNVSLPMVSEPSRVEK